MELEFNLVVLLNRVLFAIKLEILRHPLYLHVKLIELFWVKLFILNWKGVNYEAN